ncbi:L-threonylcarbamoyladenylate synthase [Clostridium cibarium]|uniref:Threonylcarbamoyl-AMP synthase n=1 Tax=Clostridium cibarium TaxID=2762247 RepID=A0ABR8PWS3_9CLOT|nr:L-threonylcarbamoyladenylate synthase [Clostridium cibarium]MBD7912641.1 threonylcarbamoyl-AMP synthase [Clostridium cibarium]
MDTKIAIVKNIDQDLKFIKEAANEIREGKTVVFPTETVYGLGADALNEEAVKAIFIAKGRPQDNPLIVHVASKDISGLVEEVPDIAQNMIDRFWPGPLTIILKKKDIIPNVTSANLSSIGIRMPDNEIALKLIELSNTPIAGPSANISGRPSPTEVERCVEDLSGKVDYIIGGERSKVGVESTIVDCTVNPPVILRPGGITLEMLRQLDDRIELDSAIMEKPTGDFKPKAPGMKYKHYSPKAKVKIVSGDREKTIEKINELVHNYIDDGKKVGILSSDENRNRYKAGEIIVIGSVSKLEDVAQNLFESLRSFDDMGVDIILSEAFEEKGVGIAVMNRLKKAAGYDILSIC